MKTYLPVIGVLGAGFALLAAALPLAGSHPLLAAVVFVLGTLVGLLGEAVVRQRAAVARALEGFGAGLTVRTGVRGLLLGGLAVAAFGDDHGTVVLVAVTLALVWLSRLALQVLVTDAVAHRLSPVSWRNLEVPGVVRNPPLAPALLGEGQRWISAATLAMVVGVVVPLADGPRAAIAIASAVAGVVCVLFVVLALVDALRARNDTPHEKTVDLLADALRDLSPEALFYYSRPEAIGYIANVWMPTLELVDRRVVVLVREPWNEPLVSTDTLPVVMVSRPGDIERVVPPSVRIALYPSNVATNNHLLRLPGIVDVFVGHGDSDKGGSATVLTRIFDEAWVSGPAARDRYRIADVGVRDEQVREIGRPQLAEIHRVAAPLAEDHHGDDGQSEWDYTVLYAPTREGFFAEWEYSSILSQGRVLLETLLAVPGVRVLFKPHPGTGTDDPAFGDEVDSLKDLVAAAGHPHEVVTGSEGLYSAFNRADLLVSDISSVITDFLASGKPYVVTHFGTTSAEQFRLEFPSAAGAYVLMGDGSDIAGFVQDARESDSLSEDRTRTRAYLLGDQSEDPVARFDRAFDEAVSTWGRPVVSP
ncbi:CDP-glycerol glycerophosphotransferase family protein [Phycicoccus sp. Root101]|uniref:CDP-glycerol glycerophosphotransferase family protein n=1 Tax=Phycicoccus sp. Root101 TaxID=1736421 RepID=UPI0007028A2F|nr:CDP-glycerol glycerophosphotransferase family protein [Phycicoccus sp. Root101]KQU69384.1 hypothetical protein ASC58_05745 [Phycicoccus sp. Root101]